jgi:hypothetical protein
MGLGGNKEKLHAQEGAPAVPLKSGDEKKTEAGAEGATTTLSEVSGAAAGGPDLKPSSIAKSSSQSPTISTITTTSTTSSSQSPMCDTGDVPQTPSTPLASESQSASGGSSNQSSRIRSLSVDQDKRLSRAFTSSASGTASDADVGNSSQSQTEGETETELETGDEGANESSASVSATGSGTSGAGSGEAAGMDGVNTKPRRGGRSKKTKQRSVTDPGNTLREPKKSQRKVTITDFEMMRVLGKGCAGKVLLVRHKNTSSLYALKAITKRHVLAHQELQHTLTEQAVLKRMAREGRDPFVVRLWWSFHDKENLFLVMVCLSILTSHFSIHS